MIFILLVYGYENSSWQTCSLKYRFRALENASRDKYDRPYRVLLRLQEEKGDFILLLPILVRVPKNWISRLSVICPRPPRVDCCIALPRCCPPAPHLIEWRCCPPLWTIPILRFDHAVVRVAESSSVAASAPALR